MISLYNFLFKLYKRAKMDFSSFKYAYALSGGIGSGKSSVCKFLSSCGYKIIDADKIAHQVLEEKSKEIGEEFGEEVLQQGKVNRKLLGKIVFSHPLKLKKLEQILNPFIREEIYRKTWDLEQEKKPFFVEIPLLFEQREFYNFRHKILISCTQERQIERICLRDQLTLDEALQRIKSQLPLQEKIPFATFIIDNNHSQEVLQKTLKDWLKLLNSHKI